MSSNKQSCVDWLFNKMITKKHTISELNEILKQAKSMHKEEQKIILYAKSNDWFYDFEHYYNETFGGNNEQ